jgi:outer membrane protein insertion porin family
VTFTQTAIPNDSRADVLFHVSPGARATVESFSVDISGFDFTRFKEKLELRPTEPYSRVTLNADMELIREILRDEGFLAPTLNEERTVYDSETNRISIEVTGKAGPAVEVIVESDKEKVGSRTQNRLLPVKREGTLDYAAIIEGERRLEGHFQEQGYFFANVTSVCSVLPQLTETDGTVIRNDTEFLCSALNSFDLEGRSVTVKYIADLNRRLKLVEMRLQGTDEFTIDEIKSVLESQEANILGVIPLFGYGRGFTSERILEDDVGTIRSLLRELGFREAEVRATQGVSPDGENLIITFVVDEGEPTIISGLDIFGNSAFTDDELIEQLPPLVGKNYSRAKMRYGQRKLSEFYSQAGYYDAKVDFSIGERTVDPDTGEKLFKVIYTITDEGKPVYVNRIMFVGLDKTKESAIRRALTFRTGSLLTAGDVYTSEQNLYSSDAFSQVSIRPQPAGEKADGSRLRDLIVEVEEQKPRILQWGGGYSTDVGLSGFVDIRHFNLLGNLWQGGARIRWSQKQQLVQFDYLNPRFMRDGKNRFAPLTITTQYQRDSTVTRFFRSAFDKGTFGIVQRLDDQGNPIDEFGAPVGDPTINRFSLSAETSRTISRADRSVVFFRYKFEDVRLFNIDSLLIKDLLIPDRYVRTSGFGMTFVRDTRKHCTVKYSILETIARGIPGEPCRYNAGDPTNGDYATVEYNVSAPALGANIGFHKFQASYNYYYTLRYLNNITLAGRAIIGLASVFSRKTDNIVSPFPDLEKILPISERFFAGGSTTLRGFDFESAGPRVVIVPQGNFHNSNGEPVTLDPFTVPFGGNALAVVNLEARVPLTRSVRAVPFYDGGNVFRRVGDIFNPPDVPPNDVFRRNLRVLWSHTVGLGLRLKTPVGGEFAVDYGYLLNPPTFIVPQVNGPDAILRLPQGQLHFRFSQAF